MPLSVAAPIDQALRRTGAILFAPVDGLKWMKLGACAFLATLGDCAGANGSGGVKAALEDMDSSPRRMLEQAGDRLGEHLAPALILGSLALVFGLALLLLVLWLQSRGRFMFLDGVVHDRGAVSGPWSEYRAEGNSLFGFTLLLVLASGTITVLATALGLSLAWADLGAERFGSGALLGLVLGGGTLLLNALAFGLIGLLTEDFVVPAMHARRIGALAAWRAVRAEILRPHPGSVLVYLAMRSVLALLIWMLVLMLACGTLGLACCLLAIPFIGTVVVLPVPVFTRCFSLAFLEQLGPAWTLGPTTDAPA